jgi:hypothetical protein
MALPNARAGDLSTVPGTIQLVPYLEWGPAFAGAIAAAAISFLLLTFGGAIGLSLTSPWPYAGGSALAIAIAVAWWAVIVQIGSFAAGGYLAGRLRSQWGESITTEGQFRDGVHGFMVWAIGLLAGAIVLGLTAGATLQTVAQSLSSVGGAAVAGIAAGDSDRISNGPLDYAADYLLRPAPAGVTAPAAASSPSISQPSAAISDDELRREASRIFSSAVTNEELSARDRDYLTQIVATRTGLTQADAQKRVDETIAELTRLEIEARTQIDKARKAAIIAGFIAAASTLAACAAACAGAGLGGRHRDEGSSPMFFGKHFW